MSSAEEILAEIRKIREENSKRMLEIGPEAYIRETNEIAQKVLERVRKQKEEDKEKRTGHTEWV